MTNLQLALTIAIPSMLVLVGIFLNNARFNSIDTRLTTMEGDRGSSTETWAGTMPTLPLSKINVALRQPSTMRPWAGS
jgi:hypothetical protein